MNVDFFHKTQEKFKLSALQLGKNTVKNDLSSNLMQHTYVPLI